MGKSRIFARYIIVLVPWALLAAVPFSCSSFAATPAANTQVEQTPTPPQHEVRFAVAHAHVASWCMGYLYVSADSIRYEVVRPEKDKKHGFRLLRSEMAVQQWMRMGTLENAIEIKTLHGSYHFWWMPNEDDLLPSRPSLFNPSVAAAPDTLIAALRDPSTVLGSDPAASPVAAAQGAAAASQAPAGTQNANSQSVADTPQPGTSAPLAAAGRAGLVGSWLYERGSSNSKFTSDLTLNPDGSGSLNGVTVKWEFSAGNLSLSTPKGSTSYRALLTGDLLTFSGGDLPAPRVFRRVKQNESSGLASGASDAGNGVLVPGMPPLTQEIANRGTQFMEGVLDVQLTAEQRAEFRDTLAEAWKAHQGKNDSFVDILNLWDEIKKKSPQEQDVVRERVRLNFLAAMRKPPQDRLSFWVVHTYDSAHRPIANGNPPLTLQAADAYAELTSFVISECLHQPAFKANRQFKQQLAQGIAREYSSYPAEQQKAISEMPFLWKGLRYVWTLLSEPQREALRKEWAPTLAGFTASSNNNTTAPAGDGAFQNYVNNFNQQAFVKSMASSSFNTTMSLHLNMWH